MREIIRKTGSFFEEHVEKIVLGVLGLVCLWLLIMWVVFSPDVINYDGQRLSPNEIDDYIYKQVQALQDKLKQEPKPLGQYVARLDGPIDSNDPVRVGISGDLHNGFAGLLESSISGINSTLALPIPRYSQGEVGIKRAYKLPQVGEIKDVAVEHIRAVAYVPTVPITEQTLYKDAPHEPNDIDLVTVEAKVDVADMYKRFQNSFTGIDVKEEWRDPCLAEPVFAAVELQRQEQLDDGAWSDWQRVPRIAIDHRKRMFEIIEDIDSLPAGGIKVRLLHFKEPEVRMDLLQPQPYQIASDQEEWFPPTLHREYIEQRRREALEEKREAREAEKEEQEREREDRRSERRGTMLGMRSSLGGGRASSGASYDGYGYGDATGLYGERDRRGGRRRSRSDPRTETGGPTRENRSLGGLRSPSRRTLNEGDIETEYYMATTDASRRLSVLDEVYLKYDEISLTPMIDLTKTREPLTFWAHDDTVEPGVSYRYRIRLGVFNPVAGINQHKDQNDSPQSQVILWSDFSEVTDTVVIPERLYVFAKSIQETAKSVTVEVSKYVLGYWYSEDFAVKPGEVIGTVVESETQTRSERSRDLRMDRLIGRSNIVEQVIIPESIDYSTGSVLIDSVPISDWTGGRGLRPRIYYDMLYSSDGTVIERMPIDSRNWPAELLAMFNEIKRCQREPQEPLRGWDSSRRKRTRLMPEGYEGMDGYEYEQRMREQQLY
jgi:hypothetical protein